MTKQSKAADPAVIPALILFGRDDSDRPHAAWFSATDAELAEKAAGLMGMSVLRVTTNEHRAAATALPAGRVFASGKAFTPFCAAGLYDRLTAFEGAFKPEPSTAATDTLPEVVNIPSSWADIGEGSLVLVLDQTEGAWFGAIVVEAKEDILGLRWQQWPELPPVVRRREHVALMSATAYALATEAGEQAPVE